MAFTGVLLPPLSNGNTSFAGSSTSTQTDLAMALVQTVQMQQQTIQSDQELIQTQQATIDRLTQQLLARGASPFDMAAPRALPGSPSGAGRNAGKARKMNDAACLGVVRLDYDYPPSPGDIDCPDSFSYDVYYRVVPGFTFEVCQSGRMSANVQRKFIEAIRWMDGKGVTGITGDCGFMMYFQTLARTHTSKPVFMSALAQLPAVTCGYADSELIAVLTANGDSLKPMRALIKDECGIDADHMRYIFVGCQDVPGFEAVAAGGKVNVANVTPGIVNKCKQVLDKYPTIRAFLFECTELPAYSDAVRQAFGLPVYDAITCCDFFMSGAQDNKRFGIQNWQRDWDGQQATYSFGDNLSIEDKMTLINKTM